MENRKPVSAEKCATKQKITLDNPEDINTINPDFIENLLINGESMEAQKLMEEQKHLTNMHAFIPDVAWNLVLNKLDLNDIRDCCYATPYFRTLFHKKFQNEMVVVEVFEILSRRYADKNNYDSSYKEADFSSIPWNIPANQTRPNRMTSVWKCRLVCKAWNNAIEKLHQSEDAGHFQSTDDEAIIRNKHLNKWVHEQFHPGDTPEKILEQFDRTHFNTVLQKPNKNPFLGRSVQFYHYKFDDDRKHRDDLMSLLRKYGREIWYCKFTYMHFNQNETLVEFYQFIRSVYLLMPYLQVFRFVYENANINENGMQEDFAQNQDELQILAQEVANLPLRTLPCLTYLYTENLPAPIFNEVLHKNRHVLAVEIRRKECHVNYETFSEQFTVLSELCVDIWSMEDLMQFKNYRFLLNLEMLDLRFHDSAPFLKWSTVFEAIESKLNLETLKTLIVKMPFPKTEADKQLVLEESLSYRLNLSKLEELRIYDQTKFSLDFLINLKNTLKRILIRSSVQMWFKDMDAIQQNMHLEGREQIQFIGYKENMDVSNIKTVLKALKSLYIFSYGESEESFITCKFMRDGSVNKIVH